MIVNQIKLEARRDKLSCSDHWQWWDWVAPDTDSMNDALEELTEAFPDMQYWLHKIPEVESNYLSVRFVKGQSQSYLVPCYMRSRMREMTNAKIIRCFFMSIVITWLR